MTMPPGAQGMLNREQMEQATLSQRIVQLFQLTHVLLRELDPEFSSEMPEGGSLAEFHRVVHAHLCPDTVAEPFPFTEGDSNVTAQQIAHYSRWLLLRVCSKYGNELSYQPRSSIITPTAGAN